MEQDGLLLALPDRPRLQLVRPPLVAVLCQLRFVADLAIEDPSAVAPFRQALRHLFPNSSIQPHELKMQVEVTSAEGSLLHQARNRWVFSDDEDNWHLVLTDDALSIETRRYERFDDLQDRTQQAVEALVTHIKPTSYARLGLRYINELRPRAPQWDKIIRREVLGPFGDPALGPEVTQSVGEVQMLVGGQQGLHLQHGWFPRGTTVRPQPDHQVPAYPFYLVDIDAFEALNVDLGASPTLQLSGVRSRLERYHRNIYRLFRWVVSDEYLQQLGDDL